MKIKEKHDRQQGLDPLAGFLIDRIDNPAFLIDIRCHMIHANQRAIVWMRNHSMLSLSCGSLFPIDPGDRELWCETIADLDRSMPGWVRLNSADEQPGLVGLRRLVYERDSPESDWIYVSLSNDRLLGPGALSAYAETIRLTPTEQRIFIEICRNVEPKRIARMHGVEEETVRTHLKSIRRKAGVKNIGQLLATVARLPWA